LWSSDRQVPAYAAAPLTGAGAPDLQGVLQSIAPDGSSVSVHDVTVTLSPLTVYGGAGDPTSVNDLKVGDTLAICGSHQPDHTLAAKSVTRP
jgi:hypothetical protein